jgi:FAD/FMN-containing dehydrogenase
MDRRTLLRGLAALPVASRLTPSAAAAAATSPRWVTPGDPGWPSPAQWAALDAAVDGHLSKLTSPFVAAAADPGSAATAQLFGKDLTDTFYIEQDVALTQSLGWVDAWTSRTSAYAVAAHSSADVAAAVAFARDHDVRLVVRGGGHSYVGVSNAADSLAIWTRPMQAIELHDAFVPAGGADRVVPTPAVSVGSGAMWIDAYNAVTTLAGRYVQGGGCTTVGVAGLVQGGGFGSFSKGFGTGAANLLEAEVVTADGVVRVVNAYQEPELFWALKGGGGGTFGVLTRLTLRTHELPEFFGAADIEIGANSAAAYRALVEEFLAFYRENLFNPHWGEQVAFNASDAAATGIAVSMVFQGIDEAEATAAWAPLLDWVGARPGDYVLAQSVIGAIPARDFWNAAVLSQAPGTIVPDDLPGAPPYYFCWAGDATQAGQVLYGYQSTWLSQSLLEPARLPELADALVRASSTWPITLHCNKGIAGADAQVVARTADTSMNPAVLDAFALAITADGQGPAYPGVAGHEPDVEVARARARNVRASVAPLVALAPRPTSYVNETDYFQQDWQSAFWGEHYPDLLEIKQRYDPDGLFVVHHGVGSE